MGIGDEIVEWLAGLSIPYAIGTMIVIFALLYLFVVIVG